MPDISMCTNERCQMKNSCYRFTAIPNPSRQSYAGFKPEEGEDSCEYFSPNDEYLEKQKINEKQ